MKPSFDLSLYLVTDPELGGRRSLLSIVEAAVSGGVSLVQIRDKEAGTRDLVDLAQRMKDLLDARGVPMIVNDRVDVALATGAAGVHVGQEDMPCRLVRKLMGDDAIIGVSVGGPDEARRAQDEGADYLGVSPVYVTPTKPDATAEIGLEGLAAIRRATSLPLVGIGGLSVANAAAVIEAGADGIAVVSAIVAAADPRAASEELVVAVREGRAGHASA